MILFLVAYLGGILTIVSPCILPVLPFVFARADRPFVRSGLPLLVSSRSGCAATLVPEPEGTTGSRFNPVDVAEITLKLAWMAGLSDDDRRAMGLRAAEIVSQWGPDRFARGTLEALELAEAAPNRRATVSLGRANRR